MYRSSCCTRFQQLTIANYQIGKLQAGADAENTAASVNTSSFKPSMLLDIDAGRPFELEPIVGAILERARAKRVDTPRLDAIYAALKVTQNANVKRAATTDEQKAHVKEWLSRPSPVAGDSK